MSPLITVYILNHNYGDFLNTAIKSVVSQSYSNFEIIIIDDGSSDQSENIIRKWAQLHNKIMVLRNSSPKGLIFCANMALKYARGDYLIRLDADDFFEVNAIEKLLRNFVDAYEVNQNTVGIFGNYNEIDRNANFIRTVFKVKTDQSTNELDIPVHGACTLIRKDWLAEQGGYDDTYTRQDGYYLWALAAATGKFFVLSEEVVFNYRQHSNSLSFDRSKLLAERSKISNSIIQKVGLDRNVVVIVAVRGDDIEGNPAALEMFFSSTILPLLRLRSLKKIIIMSSSGTLCDYVRTYESEKIEFTLREEVLEHQFSNLRETLLSLVDTETIQLGGSDILVIRTWVQQTVDSYIIDQLSAYLKIFSNKDVAILVRKVKGNLYKDLGNSLQSFSLSEKNHYERDTLYERINGGFSIRADRLLDLIEDKQLRVGIIETE
tara:strand:- start:162 stop:1463 length:1302 start_codon:yes stop_codon:yes gene_type:complete